MSSQAEIDEAEMAWIDATVECKPADEIARLRELYEWVKAGKPGKAPIQRAQFSARVDRFEHDEDVPASREIREANSAPEVEVEPDSVAAMGDRIKQARIALGVSVKRLAGELNVRQRTIYGAEEGTGRELIRQMGEYLRVSPQWLLTGKGEMLLPAEEQSEAPKVIPRVTRAEKIAFHRAVEARVREARELRCLTAAEVARRAGIKENEMYALERKGTRAEEFIEPVATVLNVNAEWLRTGEGELVRLTEDVAAWAENNLKPKSPGMIILDEIDAPWLPTAQEIMQDTEIVITISGPSWARKTECRNRLAGWLMSLGHKIEVREDGKPILLDVRAIFGGFLPAHKIVIETADAIDFRPVNGDSNIATKLARMEGAMRHVVEILSNEID